MSENIAVNTHQFTKGNSSGSNNHVDPAEISNHARQSEITALNKVAEVSPPVPIADSSRAVNSFSLVFDRLYQEFADKLTGEYQQMRSCYMTEYQTNFD